MTTLLMMAVPDRFHYKRRNPQIAYQCDCGSGYCYKVLRLRTMQASCETSRLLCPAHQLECATVSDHVKAFAQSAYAINNHCRIVWDWKCFEGDKHMSIDATVLSGMGGLLWCACFEIDGSTHFHHNLTAREDPDEAKDQRMIQRRWGLMRLHYKDQDVWHKYIILHLMKHHPGLRLTDSYVHCMGPVPEIIRSRSL